MGGHTCLPLDGATFKFLEPVKGSLQIWSVIAVLTPRSNDKSLNTSATHQLRIQTTVKLTPGSYHVLQLRDHLMAQLNAALSHNYTVVFDETSAKFTFTSNNIVNPSMDVLGFGANSAHKLLGFKADSQNTFFTNTLVSSGAINMIVSCA